jgi:hypothetical protein
MAGVGVDVWLVSAYAVFLLVAAYGLDLMAKRAARSADGWRNGAFVYHEDHDAWVCPQDQWLWPKLFDPANRVMRYRAKPAVCNSCPVKSTCTTSEHGREIARQVDPWPHSEAGRFHRGIACAVSVLAVLLPAASMIGRPAAETGVLAAVSVLTAIAGLPLWSHLRNAPAAFPDHVPMRSAGAVSSSSDRFTTRWSGGRSR